MKFKLKKYSISWKVYLQDSVNAVLTSDNMKRDQLYRDYHRTGGLFPFSKNNKVDNFLYHDIKTLP